MAGVDRAVVPPSVREQGLAWPAAVVAGPAEVVVRPSSRVLTAFESSPPHAARTATTRTVAVNLARPVLRGGRNVSERLFGARVTGGTIRRTPPGAGSPARSG